MSACSQALHHSCLTVFNGIKTDRLADPDRLTVKDYKRVQASYFCLFADVEEAT